MNKIIELSEKRIIRNEILKVLDEMSSTGASTKLLRKALNTSGLSVTQENVNKEVEYLQGKGVISVEHIENKALGIKRDIITITSKGIDVIEGTLQVDGIEIDNEEGG